MVTSLPAAIFTVTGPAAAVLVCETAEEAEEVGLPLFVQAAKEIAKAAASAAAQLRLRKDCQNFMGFPPFAGRPLRGWPNLFRIPVPLNKTAARSLGAVSRPARPPVRPGTENTKTPALSSVERGSAGQAGLLASVLFRLIRLPGHETSGECDLTDGYSGGTARDFHPLPYSPPRIAGPTRRHLLGYVLKYGSYCTPSGAFCQFRAPGKT